MAAEGVCPRKISKCLQNENVNTNEFSSDSESEVSEVEMNEPTGENEFEEISVKGNGTGYMSVVAKLKAFVKS